MLEYKNIMLRYEATCGTFGNPFKLRSLLLAKCFVSFQMSPSKINTSIWGKYSRCLDVQPIEEKGFCLFYHLSEYSFQSLLRSLALLTKVAPGFRERKLGPELPDVKLQWPYFECLSMHTWTGAKFRILLPNSNNRP